MSDNLARNDYDARRWELIDGKAVMMASPTWNHYRVADNILDIFKAYLKGKRCTPIGDGVDLYLPDGNRFIPDMMVVCDWDKIKLDGVHGAPDLVVEVQSPSTAINDKGKKKTAYERSGVPEYWIVSPADQSIEVYRLEDGRYNLDNLYAIYPDVIIQKMEESGEDTSTIVTEFRCSLFDDLVIRVEDVFNGMI